MFRTRVVQLERRALVKHALEVFASGEDAKRPLLSISYRKDSLLAAGSEGHLGGQHVEVQERYFGWIEDHSELWDLSNDRMRMTCVNHPNELERGKMPLLLNAAIVARTLRAYNKLG